MPRPHRPTRARRSAATLCAAGVLALIGAGSGGCAETGAAMATVAVAETAVELTGAAINDVGRAAAGLFGPDLMPSPEEQLKSPPLTPKQGQSLVREIHKDPNRMKRLTYRERQFLAKAVRDDDED